MWTITLWQHPTPLLQWGAVIGASLAGAISDLATRRIPNRLTGPFLLAGLVSAGFIGGVAGLADAFAGCALLAFPYVLLFLHARGGAGDAKLMGALGAWLGLANGAIVLVLVVIAGALSGLGFAMAKKELGAVLGRLRRMAHGVAWQIAVHRRVNSADSILAREQDQMLMMPYGVAILGGVCAASLGVLLWRF